MCENKYIIIRLNMLLECHFNDLLFSFDYRYCTFVDTNMFMLNTLECLDQNPYEVMVNVLSSSMKKP